MVTITRHPEGVSPDVVSAVRLAEAVRARRGRAEHRRSFPPRLALAPILRTLACVALVGGSASAQAPAPKTYTPSNPPRADEETFLNARVVSVDAPGHRITVRRVDVKADARDESYDVAVPAARRLGEFKPGMEVLLALRGTTVVDVKVSVATTPTPRAAGTRGTVGAKAGRASGTKGVKGTSSPVAGTAVVPQAAVTPRPPAVAAPVAPSPRGAPVSVGGRGPVGPGAPVGGVIYIAPPSPAPAGTPYPTPRPVGTPIPVGTPPPVATPIPVLVPSDAPPSPPSPGPTPSPSP